MPTRSPLQQVGRVCLSALTFLLIASQDPVNPSLRRFRRRMVASGKSKMTAIVACMRKLMILRNTLIRQNRPWRPKTA